MSSVGRTASAPYTRVKGVWLVAQFGVVLIDQRTAGNSSIQRLLLLCSLSKVFVLRPRNTSAFALSAWPLLRGCATEAKQTLLPRSSIYCMKVWLVNCVSLSLMILLGTPKRQTSPLKNLTADCAVTFLTASTSGHFVSLSIATCKYSKPRQHGERGPVCRSPRPKMARKEGSSEELELADRVSSNGTNTLHTWLLVQLHPGE